jgi:hypothetical protein
VRSALVPLGALVGFSWIIAIAVSARSCSSSKPGNEMAELVRRMCACQDRECIIEVDRDAERLTTRKGRDSGDADALEKFGAEQDLLACRREAMKRLR